MKWLITGGDGQLGRAMGLELSRQKCEHISLSHLELDIANLVQVRDRLERELPDVVLNAAAWTDVDLAETQEGDARAINAEGPKFLAESCARINAKFVHISTDYVFSGDATLPWSEGALQSPVSAYGRTKAEGEKSVLGAYPRGTYVVRTSWLYSPWGKNFVKTMAKIALEDSKNIDVVIDQIGQPTSAIDLAKQIYETIIQDLPPGIYHGTNSGQSSWHELAQKVFVLLGQDSGRVKSINTSDHLRAAVRPSYSVLGHERWITEGLIPMKNWQIALEEALPAVVAAIKIGQ